ncbi:MAG: HAMP domain-containing sensor histidine kinase [Eubacteriales bacterium]|nr:HAMP domain-containing sensor histidine kinase [Eubacteriales bacterium]
MNRITGNTPAKATAMVLLCLSVLLLILSSAVPIVVYGNNLNNIDAKVLRDNLFSDLSRQDAQLVFYGRYYVVDGKAYFDGNTGSQYGNMDPNRLGASSFYYEIKDESGTTVAGAKPEFEPVFVHEEEFAPDDYYVTNAGEIIYNEGSSHTLYAYIDRSDSLLDKYHIADLLIEYGFEKQGMWLAILAGSLLSIIVLLIFLVIGAGRRKDDAEVKERLIDRVPYDLLIGIYLVSAAFVILFLDNSIHYFSYMPGTNIYESWLVIVLSVVVLILSTLLAIMLLMTTSVRIKSRKLFKNTLIYRVFVIIIRLIKRIFAKTGFVFKSLPLIWKTSLILVAWFILELFGIAATANSTEGMFILWFPSRIIMALFVLLIAAGLRVLQAGGRRLAGGDLQHPVETKHLIGDLRRHGEDLNSISRGMELAVEEQLRSERFKTELITNVSHDIKTPLTSIINYADLLKKEDPKEEKIREYVAIIDKHSQRLKKLTEDLVEASKASTGNIQVSLSTCETGVLLDQTAGEYQDKLDACGLELIVNKPEYSVSVWADGRLLWRVLDNVFNNACKYSLPGSRIYVSLSVWQHQAIITVKNISRYALNISSDELMERFVRGDSSRSTEGSGLGLAIARSLTELQGGSFLLEIDGDLFKTIIKLPLSLEQSETSEDNTQTTAQEV